MKKTSEKKNLRQVFRKKSGKKILNLIFHTKFHKKIRKNFKMLNEHF